MSNPRAPLSYAERYGWDEYERRYGRRNVRRAIRTSLSRATYLREESMMALRDGGWTYAKIGKKFNVSGGRVAQIIEKRYWRIALAEKRAHPTAHPKQHEAAP